MRREDAAQALWITGPGETALREETIAPPAAGEVLVETAFGGISRGTEALVLAGAVPESEHERMRCPHQGGAFPFPVKYGYAAVGTVVAGEPSLLGRTVLCLHPHQDRFVVDAAAVTPVPDDVPPARAVLGPNMETALNVLWDAGATACDRIAVVGAGTVGLLVAHLAARLPGARVTVVDVDPARAAIATAFGCRFALPQDARGDHDVVVHASASEAGLALAIDLCGFEARLVEASWYGGRTVTVPLGGPFHSRRITIASSQVGAVSPRRRARRGFGERMADALSLLADDRLDALISGETDFVDIDGAYPEILARPGTLCHRIRYTPVHRP